MNRKLISIGMIGLPTRAADPVIDIISESDRMNLTGIYTPRYTVTKNYARNMVLAPFGSLRRLSGKSTIDGLIWNRLEDGVYLPKWIISSAAKPVFVRQSVLGGLTFDQLKILDEEAQKSHTVLFPELVHRWTPSTLRLRELIATQLGAVQSLQIKLIGSFQDRLKLVNLIDWVQLFVRMPASDKSITLTNGSIQFLDPTGTVPRCVIEFFPSNEDKGVATPSTDWSGELICANGQVRIESPNMLSWRSGSQERTESLDSERSGTEVAVDLFGRRLAGGIVPIPTLSDFIRASEIVSRVVDKKN